VTDAIARRVVVHGRVQGVFFRDATRREAERQGVAGWVRNCSDGTVEAWFEGGSHAVGAMLRWCREGPRHADVAGVDVSAVEVAGLGGFVVRG
jgi:acylphosphatase